MTNSPQLNDMIETDLALTNAGFVGECIGGYFPSMPGLITAEDMPEILDAMVRFYHDPADGEVTPEIRERILSRFMVTEGEAARQKEAQGTIDSFLSLAELAETPDEQFAMQSLARMEKPNLIPTVLREEQNRVTEVIMQRFEQEVREYLRAQLSNSSTFMADASAQAFAGEKAPALPVDPAVRLEWESKFEGGIIGSLNNKLRLGLGEALTNSVMHGNNGHPEKLVSVYYGFKPDTNTFSVVITDQGQGFDVSAIRDPRLEENLGMTSGRGVLLMNEFLSRTEFSKGGRQVTLEMDLAPMVALVAQGEAKNIHTRMRRDAFNTLEQLLTADESPLRGTISTLAEFYLQEGATRIFDRACQSLGEGYSREGSDANISELAAELAKGVKANTLSRFRLDVQKSVGDLLRNEYRVDTEQSVLIDLGISYAEAGPVLNLRAREASSPALVNDANPIGSVEFQARKYSPDANRIPSWSFEHLKALVSVGIFGNTPAEQQSFAVAPVLARVIDEVAISIAKRHFKLENTSEAAEKKVVS